MLKSVMMVAAMSLTVLPVVASAGSMSLSQVQDTLHKAGYTQIHEIERDDGLWEADVLRADGRFAEVWVDPATGEIFDQHDGRATLTAGEVLAHAAKHGLRDIHDLERDGAIWELEARDRQNRRVDVRLSGVDGRILRMERDEWFD